MKSLSKKTISRLKANKTILLTGGAIIAVLIGSLFFLNWDEERFNDLTLREGDGYELLVPASWQTLEGESQTTYFSGPDVNTSNDAIIVGHSAQPVPGYEEYDDEQKAELLVVLEALMNNYVSASDSSSAYQEITTSEADYPQADLALNAVLSGTNAAGTSFKGEGRMIVTENGYFYFLMVGSEADVFNSESEAISSILNSFVITRL